MAKVLGVKKAMTQVFGNDGEVVPVTVVDLADVYLAYKDEKKAMVGIGTQKHPNKPMTGVFKDAKKVPVRAIEVEIDDVSDINVGDALKIESFVEGSKVQVTGISKGKGFAGVVKRWKFSGGPRTHGQSDRHRAPGSIGAGTTPGRVYKGLKMAGRHGSKQITVKNLDVIKVDTSNKLLLIKGCLPGPKGSIVIISL